MDNYKPTAEAKAYADGVPVYCAHDAIVDVTKLVPNPKNPNTHPDEQIQLLGRIIRQTGWRAPITVSTRSGFIVKGHGRLSAALLEGVKEVPVDYQNYASEAEEYADLVADNRIAELAEIDNKMLADIFADIDTGEIPMELTGYTEEEMESLITGLAEALHEDNKLDEPDDVPEPPAPEQVITEAGDVWFLGRHRVICGDSTNRATVEQLMDGEKADLVFTDPPYGCGFENKGVLNDNQNQNDLTDFNKQWIPLTFEALKANGSWYCWGIDESLMRIYAFILLPMIEKGEITFRNLLTWDKGLGQNQNDENMRSYAAADEKCLFVMCGVQGFNNNSDNYFEKYEPVRSYLEKEAIKAGIDAKKTKEICGVGMFSHWFTKSQWDLMTEANYRKIQNYCIENNINAFGVEYGEIKREYEEIKREYEEIKQEFYESRAYFNNTHDNMNNVWHFERTTASERELTGGHATPKPIALCSRAIKSSSREDEIVLDVFGGSGSTLIACEQERRKCRMIELDPKWCDVIVRRYIKTTGKTTGIRLFRKGKELGREEYAAIFEE